MATWTPKTNSDDVAASHINALQTGKVDSDGTATPSFAAIYLDSLSQVSCMGDSLTFNGTYPDHLASHLGTTLWNVNNFGINGQTTAQMRTRFIDDIISLGDVAYFILLGGINDIVTDRAAVDIEADLQAMYSGAHGAGIKVVAITIEPFKGNTYGLWTAPRQAVLDAVNTWISTTATGVDYIIDAYALLEDPGTPDTLLPAYASSDYLHLSTAGYTALADTIYAAATWTPIITTRKISLSGADVILNQSLRTIDTPRFAGLITTGIATLANIAVATNLLVTDSANKRVGIGTEAPGSQLHVAGTGTTGMIFEDAGGDIAFIQIKSGTPSWNLEVGREGAGIFDLVQSGIGTRLVIDTSGNMGIGRTAPAARLDLQAAGTQLLLRFSNDKQFLIYRDTTNAVLQASEAGVGYTSLVLNPAGGNVGIGTVSPGSKLSVVGLPSYTTDALAGTGGLTTGDLYTVTGTSPLQVAVKI